MMEKLDIIALGEGLVELSSCESLTYCKTLDKYYGGDTLTAAVSACREGSAVGYVSKVGTDAFTEFLLDGWQTEGLDISTVKRVPGINGIYFIANIEGDKKEVAYYRKKTAACKLSEEDIDEEYIKSASVIYASGTTQSLSLSAREAVVKAFKIAKENNILTAFDVNYDELLWSREEAKEAFDEIEDLTDILFLNTKNDSLAQWKVESYDKLIKYFIDKGAVSVILKSKERKGYFVGFESAVTFTPYFSDEKIDSTGAGDAFNGAFLHEITHGKTPLEAVKKAAVVSGLQVKKVGAIKSIPYANEVEEAMRFI